MRSVVAGTEPRAVDTTAGFTVDAFAAATASLDAAVPRHYTALVPTQLVRLLQDPRGRAALQRYDAVLLGGAAAPSALLAAAEAAGVRVLTTYGMSETAGGCVYDGEPLACSRVRIEADGRILLGGDTLASGYLGRADLTERGVRPSTPTGGGGSAPTTRDPCARTAGSSWPGAVDDVINTGGVKVAPRQVEEALLSHVAGVSEAVVVGTPDPEWGEAVGAVVVLADGREDLAVGDVRTALRGVLPGPALPRQVVAVASIPVRGPGKPDRREIRRILARAQRTIVVRPGTEGGGMLRVLPTLVLLGLTIYALVDCIQTEESRQRNLPKALWLLLILLFPLVGPIAWFLAGRPGPRPARSGHEPAAVPAWPRRRPRLPP